jgi:hypothetical protein
MRKFDRKTAAYLQTGNTDYLFVDRSHPLTLKIAWLTDTLNSGIVISYIRTYTGCLFR